MKKRKLTRALGLTLLGTTLMTFSNPIGSNAAWKQNSTGWWYTEGSSWATGWRQISGVWYYFDANGYMKTGWVKDGANWYYMNKNGAMQTGWVYDSGTWYYMNNSGAMQTGWVKVGYQWYYMNNSGAMQTGWIQERGKWYYLASSGDMKTGWFVEDNKHYYLDLFTGEMKTGWYLMHPEVTCYFDKSGASVSGWTEIDGKTYYFEEYNDGYAMAINTVVDGYYIGYDGLKQENVKPQISTPEEAMKLVHEQDADFINKLKEKNSNIEVFYNSKINNLKRHLIVDDKADILEEGAFTIVVSDSDTADLYYKYVVGIVSGKVYITSFKDRMIFEVKDNKIVNSFEQKKPDFDIEIESTMWR